MSTTPLFDHDGKPIPLEATDNLPAGSGYTGLALQIVCPRCHQLRFEPVPESHRYVDIGRAIVAFDALVAVAKAATAQATDETVHDITSDLEQALFRLWEQHPGWQGWAP